MSSYKDLKEQFVTGFSGSTKLDVALISFFLPLSLLASSLIYPRSSFFPNFLLLLTPILFSVTSPDSAIAKLLILIIIVFLYRKHLTLPSDNKRLPYTIDGSTFRYEFITYYRSLLLIATCISILAVDFPMYPRRFVKTEFKGVSLMDIGTGSVLFSSAFVARHARGKERIGVRIPQAILSCLPLWVIGVTKFLLHSAVDYHEHVSEYGVHWNFFMSLGVVVLFSAIIDAQKYVSIVIAAVSMIIYQIALDRGLEDYILNAPRDSFISMNREGIFGCIGFFSIYQIGLFLKDVVLVPGKEMRSMSLAFVVFSALSFLVGGESRRLNNLGYVLWSVAHNLFCMIGVWLADRLNTRQTSNAIIDAVNFNQLPYFMISNLLTGAVNLSMQTIFVNDYIGFVVVMIYQLVACGILHVLKIGKVKIKRW